MSTYRDDRPAKEMAEFFDCNSVDYDEHMLECVEEFEKYYSTIATPLPRTEDTLDILDLGAGTGIELQWVFERVPNARITAVDMAAKMLAKIPEKFPERAAQVKLVTDSYLTMDIGIETYDYVLSSMTMHHFLHDEKVDLYRRILAAPRPGGLYVEGDRVVTPERETELAQEYEELMTGWERPEGSLFHIDIPPSIDTQAAMLREAEFVNIEVLFNVGEASVVAAGS